MERNPYKKDENPYKTKRIFKTWKCFTCKYKDSKGKKVGEGCCEVNELLSKEGCPLYVKSK